MTVMGTQLVAPQGFGQLDARSVYHFLKSDGCRNLVSLVTFVLRGGRDAAAASTEAAQAGNSGRSTNTSTNTGTDTEPPAAGPAPGAVTPNPASPEPRKKAQSLRQAVLVRLPRLEFEDGLAIGKIVVREVQDKLPPWLGDIDEADLDNSDQGRASCKKTHQDRIERRLHAIQPLVSKLDEVLASDHPERLLCAHARACKPPVNETRMQLWFFAYLAFGKNRLALHYASGRIGRWDRMTHPSTVKRGTPSRKGKGYGYNASAAMVADILLGYRKFSGLGVERNEVYRKAMYKVFGCKVRKVNGYSEYFHPDGAPFPTPSVFWHHVEKSVGKVAERTGRIGANKERSRNAPFEGSFSENISNLMERVDWDAYAMKECPRGLLEGSVLKPLRVVRGRDARSGLFTAVGVSFASETSGAYRMAKFVQAAPKPWLCGLFGIVIDEDRWPSQGCSPSDLQDRGPGATPGAFSAVPEFQPAISQIPPAESPQSKALIEASHPHSPVLQEGMHYVLSDKTPFELVREVLLATMALNDTMEVTDRIPNDLLEEVKPPTALRLWKALDARLRNDAVPMSVSEAVRAFLTLVPAKLNRHGVVLLGRVFRSAQLDASGMRQRVCGDQTIDIQVYVLEACVRHVWVDFEGRIIQLSMTTSFSAGDEELNLTLEELQERDEYVKQLRAPMNEHRSATEAEVAEEFEALTGKAWNSGQLRKGRAKFGTPTAKQEAAETAEWFRGRAK